MRLVLFLFLVISAAVSAVLAGISRLIRRRETIDWRDAAILGKIAEIDGVGIHYIEQGKGAAVLLIHGFGGHTYSFRHTIPALAGDHRIVAVDLMGFGYSERPASGDYSLTAHATRVLRLMDHLGIERAAAVGHSMGGEVVMRMASTAPDRISALVLAGSVSGDRLPSLPVTPLVKPFLPAMTRFTSLVTLRRSVHDPSHFTPEVRDAYLAPMRLKGSMNGLYQILHDGRSDKKIDYSRITQPVLVLWAEEEKIVPKVALRKIQQHLPQSEVVTIDNAGHLLLEEQPEACNAAIRRFLVAPPPEATVAPVTVDEGAVPA